MWDVGHSHPLLGFPARSPPLLWPLTFTYSATRLDLFHLSLGSSPCPTTYFPCDLGQVVEPLTLRLLLYKIPTQNTLLTRLLGGLGKTMCDNALPQALAYFSVTHTSLLAMSLVKPHPLRAQKLYSAVHGPCNLLLPGSPPTASFTASASQILLPSAKFF